MFYLYRLSFLGEDDIVGSFGAHWRHTGRWWYTLAHVCQRWRNIILGSATYLDLSLVCTYDAPVARMLAHSPPLPLVIGYFTKGRKLTKEDEEGTILALGQHDSVRRVRLGNSLALQKIIMAMNEEYPILEYLYIMLPTEDNSTILTFQETLQTPHLRHLTLQGFTLPMSSQLLTTAVGLVTLHLAMVHPSTYFHPNTLIQWISLMPQLETLKIYFRLSIPSRDIERQLAPSPIIAPITLPNLRHFHFRGVSAYSEALFRRIIAPRLEKIQIEFFDQLTFSVPCLLQSINTAENLSFRNAVLTFSDKLVGAGVYPPGETKVFALSIVVKCWHLDWQVSSMAQISNSLSQIFSAVERLVLQHDVHSSSSEEHNEVDHTEWHELLRPFSNVKTLRIQKGLVKDISRCLQLAGEEQSLVVLPELHELTYFGSGDTRAAFTSFINARRKAGRPVALIRL